ncbi:MAG: monooxygenase, partial [Hamadaea sp.]|nr:monooxygenase [Hamadaea sp.]
MRPAHVSSALIAVAIMGAAACSRPATTPAAAPTAAQPTAAHSGHGSTATATPAPLRAGATFVDLAMGRPFTAKPARGTDEYRCFLLDPGLT